MKVGIVTDSGADLPKGLAAELGIEMVPFPVSIGNQHYRDGIDLAPEEFYDILKKRECVPRTSQPAPGIFVDTYRRMLKKYEAIISIHITGRLSGTVQSAQLAKEAFPEAEIRVVDSLSVSMGLGSLVLEAYRALQRNHNLEQVVKMLEYFRDQIRLLIVLDTLEYVQRGGRISKLKTFLGSILRIKPLLTFVNGEIELLGKARSRRQAVSMLMEEFKKVLPTEKRAMISVIHTAAEKEAEELKEIMQDSCKEAEFFLNQAGPALGVHAGPGALALIMTPKFPLEQRLSNLITAV